VEGNRLRRDSTYGAGNWENSQKGNLGSRLKGRYPDREAEVPHPVAVKRLTRRGAGFLIG